MRTVFITGGAGFIGAHLVKHFANNNNVVVYDHFKKDTLVRLGYDQHPNVKVVKGDVLEAAQVQEAMKGADVVIHAAAVVGVDEVNNDQLSTMTVNINGTLNVLEAARLENVQGRVVVFSTSEIFGPMAFHVKETDPVISGPPGEPRWGYGISKIAGEHLANAYYKRYGLPTVCVRPFNVYGPGQTMNGAMKMFVTNALQNIDINIHGDGSPIRAWCYIDDFVDCLVRCTEDPKAINESFNIGNPYTGITVLQLAEHIVRLLGSQSKVVHGNALASEIHLRIPSIDKAREVLGYEPKVQLDEGILKTAESIKQELAK